MTAPSRPPGTPQISVDGSPLAPVQPKTLAALAIYLHALADSYSHEACMKNAQFRGHKPSPLECTAIFWHLEAEYGAGGQAAGVPYTKEAGLATWLALKWFRQELELDGAPLWSDATA